MGEPAKRIGRPLRNGSDLDAAREAILSGCSMYETARRSGISMYTFHRLRKELREGSEAKLAPLPTKTTDPMGGDGFPAGSVTRC